MTLINQGTELSMVHVQEGELLSDAGAPDLEVPQSLSGQFAPFLQ